MKPVISKLAAIVLADALIAACSNGHAVRVDCDGPLTLINPPARADAARQGVGPAVSADSDRRASPRKPSR